MLMRGSAQLRILERTAESLARLSGLSAFQNLLKVMATDYMLLFLLQDVTIASASPRKNNFSRISI
ncbi:MAG: hypothetical protein CMN20_00550 [Roseovarius sp.]|nr:hypothetical protein [Roseovarius sp.]MBK43759.1 hypothetical protein [Roseovarius sp.]MBK43810.1 hypothetical protein [Roseovarius sp.]